MKQKIVSKNNNDWNGNNQNPWGQKNSRQDFENPFNGLQKLFSKFLPGGGKSWRGLIAILIILFVLWSLSGIYRVNADEQGVVLRFGKFTSQTGPGLHYHLPYPIAVSYTHLTLPTKRIV